MAFAEVELVPLWYVVEVASLTVTFWPVDVDIAKLDVDTLPTVPDAPPEAGPDRALDPPPPDPKPPAEPLPGMWCPDVAEADVAVAEGGVAAAEGDVAQPAESPITPHISAAATIHRLLLFDSNRRTPGRRACLAMVTEADQSGEDAGGGGGAASAAPELPATDGPDVALMVSLRENMETSPSVRWEYTEPRESR
jgi:hypothetical protein